MTLHDAARSGDLATLLDRIDGGAPVDGRDGEGRTPLLLAAEAGNLAVVRALVEAGAEFDTPALPPDADSNDPPTGPILPVVCRRGLIDRIWPLVGGQVTVRDRRKGNPDGPTPLMTAAAAGHEAIVAWLLEAGATVNQRDRDGFTALAYAAAFDREAIVRALVRAGADLDPVDHYGFRPLGLAARFGQAGAVRALVETGADLTAATEFAAKMFNRTPLEIALEHDHAEVVALLASGGADTSVEDSRRLTPVLRAVARCNRAALGSMLAAGANPNRAVSGGPKANPFDTQALPDAATPLHLAACREEPEFVADLLAAGADAYAKDSLGFTPLALALASGHAEAARLLRIGAPPAEEEASTLRAYELVAAVRQGDEPVVRVLLAAGADPGATIPDTFKYHYLLRCEERESFGDFDPGRDRGPGTFGDAGRSVLALAIERGHDGIACLLMAAGAPSEGAGGGGWPGEVGKVPLIVAAREGRRDVVAALLAAGARPNARDDTRQTPLFHAAIAGHAAIVRDLIAAGARLDLKDGERNTALHYAAAYGHADCVRTLLEARAEPRPPDLSHAALGGHVETACALLEAMKARGIAPEPHTLASAVSSGSADLVRRLLEAGLGPSCRDESGVPALSTACRKSHELVQLLLDAGADPNATDAGGATPLSIAVLFGGPAAVRLLLERGASPEARFDGVNRGETPLIRLAGHGMASMVGWHKDPDVLAQARARDIEIIRMLLARGADVEARDWEDGRTALMHAAATGDKDILRVLLDAGARVDARDERNGATPLHWAAQGGRGGAVELLLAAGADPLAENADGLTPDAIALRAGHDRLARDLRAKAGDRPRRGRTVSAALRKAAEANDTAALRAALNEGADVNARFAGKKTPLLLASARGSVAMVEALLAAGADPNVRDADDATPLVAAIEAKSAEVVQRLLDAGADPDAGCPRHGGEERQAPLMIAIGEASLDDEPRNVRLYLELVRALIAAGAAPDGEDAYGTRPLWYALDLDAFEIADLLIKVGAGGDVASEAYGKVRKLPRAARVKKFLAQVDALAEHLGISPEAWTGQASRREYQRMRKGGRPASEPVIGARFRTTRDAAEALLAEQDAWRRRGAFLVRTSRFGEGFDFTRQAIGVLPTEDPYVVIAAICGPGTDWGWISPAFYIRDLKALEDDYPFTLIGCERHSLELQFAAPIADPADLARRLGGIRTHLGAPDLSESPDEEEVAEYLAAHARIGFYWE